jgi:SH3 domain-containing YSC84-like protein 1
MRSQLSPSVAARTIGALAIASLLGFSSFAETPDKRIRSATDSFQEIMRVPEKGIPRDLLEKAECVVIIPGLKKGAFLVGGKYGRGFVSCRRRSDR